MSIRFQADNHLKRVIVDARAEAKTCGRVVDTGIASFVFKWHPEFAPHYVAIMRGSELVVSFTTLAEMRQGATGC